MSYNAWALGAVALVAVASFYLGHRSSKLAESTQDFLLARRTVRSRRNAAAISGEYLSAASFLGIAGVVLKDGADALWYPIGFTAGYLALMLFVAAPLRRSGAYTLPDFIEARLSVRGMRLFAGVIVVLIGVLYLVPQLQGAGMALTTVMSVPAWTGAVAVTVIVALNVVAGGMRAITVVQAFQYWLKLTAIAVPTFVLCAVFFGQGGAGSSGGLTAEAGPMFTRDTTVTVETPVLLQVSEDTRFEAFGVLDGDAVSGFAKRAEGVTVEVGAGTTLRFAAGSAVPIVAGAPVRNSRWLQPADSGGWDLAATYSLIFATFLGTMGLPHVLVRFYTNPDGKAARRTTLHVLLLLGLFYLFPTMLGALSRLYVPELLVTGETDAAVLLLPSAMLGGLPGQIVTAVVAAGAFAAFLSVCSGLVFSVAGVVADELPGRIRVFRPVAVLVALLPLGLALVVEPTDLTLSVSMAFTLAASTFAPVLLLGIWWRGLTARGALLGMVVGGGLVLAAYAATIVSSHTGDWAPAILYQPALFTVPAAFLTAILVSGATKTSVPAEVNAVMLRMHAPDPLGFVRDREIPRYGQAEERIRLGSGRHRR